MENNDPNNNSEFGTLLFKNERKGSIIKV